MKKNANLWILIAVVAAAVAAATTIVVLVLRARQKAKSIIEPIYDCGCCEESQADECAEDCAE